MAYISFRFGQNGSEEFFTKLESAKRKGTVMKRNRRDNAKKERIVMIASSVFVLTALTMTGMYMQSREQESQDDGYTIDFTALENQVEDKYDEIARNEIADGPGLNSGQDTVLPGADNMENDLDYLPMEEAGSNLIQIPGLTDDPEKSDSSKDTKESDGSGSSTGLKPFGQDGETSASETANSNKKNSENEESGKQDAGAQDLEKQDSEASGEQASGEAQNEAAAGQNVIVRELHFAAERGLLRPLEGQTVIPFSMDASIHFTTLDQYTRNPALMIGATEGTVVTACAEGKVIRVFKDAKIGNAVTMELGDGYELTYGQLGELNVQVGSYVEPGEVVGVVAAPTKYYTLEGANLYLKLTENGTPVDPEALFR